MSVIVNITSFNCTTNEENLTTSNTGWTTSSTSPFGTATLNVQNAASPVSVFANGAPTLGYLRTETPGSANQTVKATLRRVGDIVEDQFIYIGARINGDDRVEVGYAALSGGTPHILIVKCIDGTRTTVVDSTSVGSLASVGDTGLLELRISGQSPNILVSMWWNGTQIDSTQTLTETQLNATGAVGFFNRVNGTLYTNGVHFTTFYAEDDTGGGITQDLDADATAAAAAAAELAIAKALGGSAGASGQAAADALVLKFLLAAASGQAVAAGDLGLAKLLAGAASAGAAATGDLQTSAGATITTPPLKNNTGTLLVSESGATVHVYTAAGVHVVTKTGQITNGSAVMTINDAALVAATSYRIVIVLASGAEGMETLVAA